MQMTKSENYLTEYNTTDRQLHWLSQVIARINSTFIPHHNDDSHTNLYFDPVRQGISGRWINAPSGILGCFLDLNTMTIKWRDRLNNELHEVLVFHADQNEILASTGRFLQSAGMSIEGMEKPMHYEIPDYDIERINEGDISKGGLKHWRKYRELANTACYDMLGYLQSDGKVRIWPHHFDTGIYTQVKKQLGLGFGLAMKDAMVGAPYFYLAGYGNGMDASDKGFPGLSKGYWEKGGSWKGAVLPLTDISDKSYQEALKPIRRFIHEVSSWYLHIAD
jgi:hypothetical protein